MLQIKSRISDDRLVVYAHVLGRITSSLERQNIDASTLDVFKDLPLADTHFNANTPVDILLESEHVWSVFTGRKIYDNKGIDNNGYRQHATEVLGTRKRSRQQKIGTRRRTGQAALSHRPQSR